MSAPEAAAFVASEVRAGDFDRYAAALFVPPERRRSLLALAAFHLEIARIPAQVTQPLPGEIRLQWWRDLVEGRAHGGAQGNPVAAELLAAIAAHDLPASRLMQSIDAREFDLYNDPMPTMPALEDHLGAAHGALFALDAQIMGCPADALAHAARHAGIAQGIAEIVTALPRHASQRRLFVPQQMLDQHGCDIESVFAGKTTPELRAVLGAVIAQARDHLDTAMRLLADAPAEARPAFLPLALTPGRLDALARGDRELFAIEPQSRLRTLWTLWRARRSKVFR